MTDLARPPRIDTHLGLSTGWNLDPDWQILLMSALRDAVQLRDEVRLVGFARLGVELCREGQVRIASAVAQVLQMTVEPKEAGRIRDHMAEPVYVVEAALAQDPQAKPLPVSVDHLAGAIADAIGMYAAAAELNMRAGRGFDKLGDADSAGFAYQTAGGNWLWLERPEQALNASSAAVERFRDSGNLRGEAEALLTYAEAAIEVGDLSRADECVSRVGELVPRLRSTHLTTVWRRTRARIDIALGRSEEAHRLLVQALRASRRSGDSELEVVILHDLAILAESAKGPKRAAQWWRKALTRAEESGLAARELDIARGASLNAMETDSLDAAIGILEQATQRHAESRPTPFFERARAEMGALLLARGARQLSEGGRTSADLSLEQGDEALKTAIAEFVSVGDADWAGRAARNLKLSWRLQGKQCEGTAWLRSAASGSPGSAAASGLSIEAAMLGIGCPEQAEWSASWIRSQAAQSDGEALAMELARESYMLDSGDLLQDTDGSLALMRLACDVAKTAEYWGYGDLVNDLGIRLARADLSDQAETAFSRAVDIAEREENRALKSLALANLAELHSRRSENDVARRLFALSAELAEAVGDLDQAIASWAGTTRIDIDGSQTRAAETTRRMVDLASRGVSPQARATTLSAQATAAYVRGAYAKAFTNWRRAASLASDNRGEYLAFALDALARRHDRERFERELERTVSSLGRNIETIDFCNRILRAAFTWASAGDADAASLTIATSTALAGATLTSTQISTDAQSLFMRSMAALRAGELVINELDDGGSAVADSVDRHVRALIGDEPAEALRWILEWANDDTDTDTDPGKLTLQ